MQRDLLSVFRVIITFLLVTSPFWMFPHADDTTTVYTAERIEYGSEMNGGIGANGPIRGLDCWENELTRGCLFAEQIVSEGPITIDPSEPVISERQFADSSYVAVGIDPAFRRQNISSVGNGSEPKIRYSLDPIGPATVLQGISREETELPPRIREVLDGRNVTVHGRVYDIDGVVVRSEQEYYRIKVVSRSEPTWGRNRSLVLIARGIPFVIGVALLRNRWRA